jgi:hypothetical protein
MGRVTRAEIKLLFTLWLIIMVGLCVLWLVASRDGLPSPSKPWTPFPNVEGMGSRTLSLPLSAKLSDQDVDDVIAEGSRWLISDTLG